MPESETWILGDRREGERRAPKMHEPVTLRVFVTVLSAVIVAAVLWLSSTGAGAVTSSQRFERDSARRDFDAAMQKRDVQDVRASTARTDTNVYRLCVMLAPAARRGECR